MFSNWQQEKAVVALVDEAQALSDKLAEAKPHIVDSHAAAVQFWAASYLSTGLNLYQLSSWKPADVQRFCTKAQTKIAALRKKREYASSDGLAIWLHTAHAVTEPRVASPVRDIWRQIAKAGPNADAMAMDLLQDAGLAIGIGRLVPIGFDSED
ncbi:MAG: hypothetical protein I8H94_00015 [Rhodobacteraceae bacterium]|nr:hypothetical protein [Paracoccaceae bacterium]